MTATPTAPDTVASVEADRPTGCDALFSLTVNGGFGAAFRVGSMLRTRTYDVRRLTIDVAADGEHSRVNVRCTLAPDGLALLRARLERLPAVLSVSVSDG